MTTLPIPTGPTNKEIITRAYQVLGLKDSMFERTADELASAMLPLGSMMLEWPFDQLGFIYEDEPGKRAEEESGIDRKYLDAVAYSLAQRLAPTLGKDLSGAANKEKNRLYSWLCGNVAVIPTAETVDATFAGSGHRWVGTTYFAKA